MIRPILAALAAATLTLSACSGDAEVTAAKPIPTTTVTTTKTVPGPTTTAPAKPAVTITKAAPAKPAVTVTKTTEPEASSADEPLDYDMSMLAAELAWLEKSASDQADMCWMWNYDKDRAMKAFEDGAEGSVDQEAVEDFFDGEC